MAREQVLHLGRRAGVEMRTGLMPAGITAPGGRTVGQGCQGEAPSRSGGLRLDSRGWGGHWLPEKRPLRRPALEAEQVVVAAGGI